MDYPNYEGKHNKNKEGYKVPGDGNEPNVGGNPGNESFEENPSAMEHKPESDIPGKQFNIGDKAYHDSSKEDFTETTSKFLHADNSIVDVDMHDKKPDGDR